MLYDDFIYRCLYRRHLRLVLMVWCSPLAHIFFSCVNSLVSAAEKEPRYHKLSFGAAELFFFKYISEKLEHDLCHETTGEVDGAPDGAGDDGGTKQGNEAPPVHILARTRRCRTRDKGLEPLQHPTTTRRPRRFRPCPTRSQPRHEER